MKRLAESLAEPLTIIFNKSLANGQYPSIMKEGIVTPLFKSSDKIEPKNYRPITMINVVAKVFEKMVSNKLSTHINKYLSDYQHGFRNKKSTVTNLTEMSQCIADAMNCKKQVDAIYLDFSKAFDKIYHTLLALKLKIYGIEENICLMDKVISSW